ncbi:preprotein translocase subunit SecY [Ureaplasma miroungigenitalium]|uniref:Protein translocase subunit SecY n=1 Tax=Ureaplasma miroungigenitalium TaxID=1042321 RepID=A0ABT3BMD1_9BACT|nr:preprotein translocase subunit SecY [Ureaplasma miroungigenitalium]MCV3728395.1 preprotein translocase subunit SecY [Ureaplasma miroungigenitalium]MCV3734182.1 preprotein translocase subunit SecY [Ureaplasma miroungigenitalium]
MKVKSNKKQSIKRFFAIFTNKKVLVAIAVTLSILILFRIGSIVPMPYIKINGSLNQQGSFFAIMNLLGGGGLSQFSIFAIGIGPYITAQIIMQLLSTELIPPLFKLAKSGERGRKKMEVITRLVTLPLAIMQAVVIINLLSQRSEFVTIVNAPFAINSPLFYVTFIFLMVAGTYVSLFLADIISKKGVGNGITLLILTGIIANLFNQFNGVFNRMGALTPDVAKKVIGFILYVVFYLLILFGVTFINSATRKIPIQQTGQALISDYEKLPFLPIKIMTAGVMPVIFASSLLAIPAQVSEFLDKEANGYYIIQNYFIVDSWTGLGIYVILIILFTFFFSYVQLNPPRIAEDLKKSGRFIPGVKVGLQTENHISKVIFRINWTGAILLAALAALPHLVALIAKTINNNQPVIASSHIFGGTSLIIMVSATLELWNAIKSTATSSTYSYQRQAIENNLQSNNDASKSQIW